MTQKASWFHRGRAWCELDDLVEVHDPFGKRGSMKRMTGRWIFPVCGTWRGGVEIVINVDTDAAFVKLRRSPT